MQDVVQKLVLDAAKKCGYVITEVEASRPEEEFGDFATNVALQLAGKTNEKPHDIAEKIADELANEPSIAKVTVAGPGFINITLKDEILWKISQARLEKPLKGQVIVAEYSDPNPFKVLHAGHIFTTVIGDAIARLLEDAGATVYRVNYGGDVGLHVAKTMWGILHQLQGEYPERLTDIPESERMKWIADRYVEGHAKYEDDLAAKDEIVELNKKVYEIHATNDRSSKLAQIYWTCRTWSYESFDAFYKRFGTKLDKYYPESEITELGLETVKQHIGKVFEESDGAIVFRGEPYGLHTRVFINSKGLPTYEAKEVGLLIQKYEDYKFDRSFVITGNEQEQYMAVMLKAMEQFLPELTRATTYIPHGMLRLAGGVKMASRKGNVVQAYDVLDMTAAASKKLHGKVNDAITMGAIKYAFLKARLGGDIVYDPEDSVAIEGNSGPYIQYAHARARSILQKATSSYPDVKNNELDKAERSLLLKITEYPEVVAVATTELMPHHICTYLYQLAQTFNRFYEQSRVIGDERELVRLQLVRAYADTLKKGLELLNIAAPEHM